jgi:hypothetical protein
MLTIIRNIYDVINVKMEESKLCGRKKKSKMEFCKYINNGKAEK